MDDDTTQPDPPDAPDSPDSPDAPDAPDTSAGAPGDEATQADDATPADDATAAGPSRFSRRQVLTMAGAGGLVGAGLLANLLIDDEQATGGRTTANRRSTTTSTAPSPGEPPPAPAPAAGTARWSDPATWGGTVPGSQDVAVVDKAVVLDVDASVAGVRVEGGGELVFDVASSRTLTSTGNVIVDGALRARPQAPDVTHRIVFEGIDERRVVGDHTMEPLDTDIGLWVVGGGVLDLQGARKRAWTNLTAPVAQGDTTITVADAEGWQVGDEVVVTPTEPTTVEGYAERYDRRTVSAIDGTSVTLDQPAEFAHPAITVRPGVTHHAEVLNLTRNVRVEGTPDGRAHVMLLDISAAQNIGYVGLRHLGPQQPRAEGGVQGAVGRYSLHLHMSHDATRGTVVDGAVAYDGGNHSFVPHLSHGVTFRDCIAHDQANTAFWWDQPTGADGEPQRISTDELVYERCVASQIRPTEASTYDVAGFLLAPGRGQAARGCVAVGVLGQDEASPGFKWSGDVVELDDTWEFEDCVSHNNDGSSIYFWINGVPHSYVDRFTAYHDRHGIRAGAYTNLVSYRDCTVYACVETGVAIQAVPGISPAAPEVTVTYENLYVDQAGLSDYAVTVGEHVVEADTATRFTGGHFAGGTTAQVGFPEEGVYAQLYEFSDCTYDGNAFWLADPLTEVVDITVRDSVNGAIRLRPSGQDGERRSEWNASVSPA